MTFHQIEPICISRNSDKEVEYNESVEKQNMLRYDAQQKEKREGLREKLVQGHCFTCLDHVLNGNDTWMSTHDIYMSDFRRSHERGCKLCSLVYRGLIALDSAMEEGNHEIQWLIREEDIGIADLMMGRNRLSNSGGHWRILFRRREGKPKSLGISAAALELPRRFDSEKCFTWIEDRIADCKSNHNHDACRREAETMLPTRIVDLGTGHESLPRLCESHSGTGKYMALSHCWGKCQQFITTKETLVQKMIGFEMNELPQTFRDAITVARRLNIRLLWIDALCIIQDDEADWDRESAVMAKVYSNAYVTLVATSSMGDQDGFLRERPPDVNGVMISSSFALGQAEPDVVVSRVMNHEASRTQYFIGKDAAAGGPLGRRAWALQEDILSRRIISFQKHEIVWECPMGRFCECGEIQEGRHDRNFNKDSRKIARMQYKKAFTFAMTNKEVQDFWASTVVQYSERLLSEEGDKLPALSGLASRVRSVYQDDYLAGLWRSNLIIGLLWEVKHSKSGSLPQQYRAPSWSWASLNSVVVYRDLEERLFDDDFPPWHFHTSVLDAQCTPLGHDLMGRVKDGYVCLSGPILNVRLKDLSIFKETRSENGFSLVQGKFKADTSLMEVHAQVSEGHPLLTVKRCFGSDFDFATSSAIVRCILIEDHYGVQNGKLSGVRYYTFLVLRLLTISDGIYERLGTWKVDTWHNAKDTEWIKSGKIEVVKLI